MTQIDISGKRLNTEPIVKLITRGEKNADVIEIALPRVYGSLDLGGLGWTLAGVSDKGTRAEQILSKEAQTDKVILRWTVGADWSAVAGSMTLELTGSSTDGGTVIRYAGKPIVIAEDVAAAPAPPPPSLAEQYLTSMREIAAKVQNEASRAGGFAGEASKSAAAALASQNAAAGSATTASTKAGEASKSAAAAKVSETASAGSLTDINSGLVSKLPISEANSLIKSVALDEKTGVFTFTRYDKSVLRIDTALEKTVMNFVYDARTKELVLTLESGQVLRIPLSDLIDDYSGADTATVSVAISGDNRVSAVIRGNSIAMNLLDLALQNTINGKVTANQSNNAAQIKFADGQNMQQKLDAGAFDGEDGKDGKDAVFAPVDGMYYMRVDEKGNLVVGVNSGGTAPPLTIRGGQLVYTVG